MQFTNSLVNDVLAAYGEYSEETAARLAKKVFVPVNHLGGELSPYLLQHARDPVGWYTWSPEAFDTARHEDKPIFLSVGYSSDHWCHVMSRECFNDVEVAGMLNDAFIPVCVDKEERPDLDDMFMEVCRVQNGSAGWPLNIFLTPEGRPFFCTTWLPKRTTGQMPGITELLPRIKWLWHVQRNDVERAANDLAEMVRERFDVLSGTKYRGGRIRKYTAYEALNDLRRIFDMRWGGFGTAPKFPEPDKLLFLLSLADEKSGASKHDRSDAFTMVDVTLRRMWRGGIHDHLGGGFSRYAIDERWLVPHFEKLLCYQAVLLLAVSKAQELQQNSFHRLFAEDIIFCITRYFCDGDSYSQGFRTSMDGDTPEGEGRYYLWTEHQIKSILPEGDGGLFCSAYAVLPSGNFGNELAGSQMGWNILYEASTVTELAKRYGIKGSEVGVRLSECRKLLLEARERRSPLRTDNKILMSWNGLMIGALARASVAFEQSEWRDIAERSALFIQKNFLGKDGKWHRRWIDGKTEIDALSEDFAYFLWGVLELYKAIKHFNPAGEKQLGEWLKCAQELADVLTGKFWDEKYGGLFMNAGDDKNIFTRFKSGQDVNSLPSVNALAAMALNELAIILEEKKYSDYARKIIDCFSYDAINNPMSYLSMIRAGISWKPVRKKPAPPPAPVPTDEELNREEQETPTPSQQAEQDDRRTARASRRAARTTQTEKPDRAERAARRSARTHRAGRER